MPYMHCKRCHHAGEAHADSDKSSSILRLGRCRIPFCTCAQYVDVISVIDEDLL